jgi:hypothetical protein
MIYPRCITSLEAVWVLVRPMDLCDVHVSLSNSLTSASLGSVTCLPPKIHVVAISPAEVAWTTLARSSKHNFDLFFIKNIY